MASRLFLVAAALYPCPSFAQTHATGTCDIDRIEDAIPTGSPSGSLYCEYDTDNKPPFDTKCCASQSSCSFEDLYDKCCQACSSDTSCAGYATTLHATSSGAGAQCSLYTEHFDFEHHTWASSTFAVGLKQSPGQHCIDITGKYDEDGVKISVVSSEEVFLDGCIYAGVKSSHGGYTISGTVDGTRITGQGSIGDSHTGVIAKSGDITWDTGNTWIKVQAEEPAVASACIDVTGKYDEDPNTISVVSSADVGLDGCIYAAVKNSHGGYTMAGTVDGTQITSQNSFGNSYTGVIAKTGLITWNTGNQWIPLKLQAEELVVSV